MRGCWLLVVACCMTGGLGCGVAGKQSVSGTVEVNNQPLQEGEITFEPLDKSKGLRPEGAHIQNGSYSLYIMPGTYAVKIHATKKVPVKPGTPTASGEKERAVSIIPPEFNEKTKLKADVSSSSATHNFKITSKK